MGLFRRRDELDEITDQLEAAANEVEREEKDFYITIKHFPTSDLFPWRWCVTEKPFDAKYATEGWVVKPPKRGAGSWKFISTLANGMENTEQAARNEAERYVRKVRAAGNMTYSQYPA